MIILELNVLCIVGEFIRIGVVKRLLFYDFLSCSIVRVFFLNCEYVICVFGLLVSFFCKKNLFMRKNSNKNEIN